MSPGVARDLVFVSYSHANPDWRDKMLVLLKPFARQGQLQVWADPYIRSGDVWHRTIDEALARTRVGVVLLTPDLLASDFIADVELPHLLRAARAGDVTLIVVPIEAHVQGSTRFADGDLTDFQWPWTPEEPIAELDGRRRNRALVTVAKAIVECAASTATPSGGGVAHERLTPSVLSGSDRLADLHGVPVFPPHYLPRADEYDVLKRAVLGDTVVVGVSAVDARVGVHGQGGLGKSVLALSVAHDEEVRRTFPDGIFWISIGQQPQLESLQADLADQFGERTSIERVGAGMRVLHERLAGKACLVILDDVWHLVHAKAFDVLDVRSRLLVTTRDRSIVTALGARDVRLDALSPTAAVDLMAHWVGTSAGTLPAVAREVAKEVGYLPLALSLAGAQVREGQSWNDLLAALREGRLDFLDHPYGSVFASIKASVDALVPGDAARYVELAVFPEDVAVPVSIVETLWQATGGVTARESRALLSRLASRNLLSLAHVVTMHDLQHDFVRLAANDLTGLHGRLVDAWRAAIDTERTRSVQPGDVWAGLPESPEYPWHYLTHHLDQAGRHDALEQVLTSAAWLFARLTRFNLPAALADFRAAAANVALREVRDALLLSAHVLAKDPRALMGQLRGRLLGTRHAAVQSLLESQPPDRPQAFFRPMNRCLTAPGGPLLQTFEGHTWGVSAVTVLPDGQQALSASGDGTLKLWDLTSGAVLQTLEGHIRVTAVTVLPDGQRVLSASGDGRLTLWDLPSGAVVQTFEGHSAEVTTVTVLPDGQRALSASGDRTLKLWDLPSAAVLETFEGHTDWVNAVTVLPDGERALSAGNDRTLKLWDLTSGAVLRTFEGHTDRVMAVTVLHDGQRALSASGDRTLKLWDLTTAAVLQTFEGHSAAVTTVTMLPDEQRALSASGDGTLKLWDLPSGAVLETFEGHTRIVRALRVLPDGQRALSGSDDRTLKLWDLTSGAALHTFDGHTDWVNAVTVLPDGQQALSVSRVGTLKLWDLTSGAVLQTFEGHTCVAAVTVLPDGQRALSASQDGTLKLWDLTSGAVLQTFNGHTDWVNAVTVLPDGQRALSASDDGTLRLWDLTSGAVLQTFNGHTDWVMAVTVLPGGQRALSAGDDRTLKLWDLTSGAVLRTFKGHTHGVRAVTVLPDGQRALSASADGTLKLWDLTSGAVLRTFDGHIVWASAVTVLPEGRRALSAGDDGTLKLWDLTSGVLLATFHGDAPFTALSQHPHRGVVAFDQLGQLHVHAIENLRG